MGEALEAGYDLGALALCFLAIGLLLVVKALIGGLLTALDFSIFGVRPLHGLVAAGENAVIGALDDAIKGVEGVTAKFENGLIDSFGMLIAIPALLAVGVKAALQYMWNTALPALLAHVVNPVRALANQALDRIDSLSSVVSANLGKAERFAEGKAADALASARAYTEARLAAAEHALHLDIGAAVAEAEAFANTAVAKLRAAEDLAVASAVELAAEAKAVGQAAAAAALAEAERVTGVKVGEAEAVAAQALAEAQAAGQAALGAVKAIAVTAEDDLATIEGGLGALGLAGMLATIPALGSLVHAIATESGLENAECRGKVKGICATNPSAWGDLLAGLAALGFAFSLEELAREANGLVRELAPVIAQAA